MHSLIETHLDVVYKIFRYLKGFIGICLFFKNSEIRGIEVFADVDWAWSQKIKGLLLDIAHFLEEFGRMEE